VKKWITRTLCWTYRCPQCNHLFRSKEKSRPRHKYGYALMSWCVYHNVACGVNMLRVEKSLEKVFGFTFSNSESGYRSKRYISDRYQSLYAEVLQNIPWR